MKLYGICYIFNLTETVVQLRDQLLVSHYGRIDDTISGNVIGNVIADEGQEIRGTIVAIRNASRSL